MFTVANEEPEIKALATNEAISYQKLVVALNSTTGEDKKLLEYEKNDEHGKRDTSDAIATNARKQVCVKNEDKSDWKPYKGLLINSSLFKKGIVAVQAANVKHSSTARPFVSDSLRF